MLVGPELVTNGTFTAWVGDNPTGWTVVGEVGNDPEISEVDSGQGHGGTNVTGGYCNLYSSGVIIYLRQALTLVVGRKYQFSINVNTMVDGGISIKDSVHLMLPVTNITEEGIRTVIFVATHTNPTIEIKRFTGSGDDMTFDDVSVRFIAETDLSRTGQRFSSFPEN